MAFPISLNMVGMLALVTVDVLMVGRLGSTALGTVALANALAGLVTTFGVGALSPVSAMVARSRGASDEEGIRTAFGAGLWAAALLSVPMVLLLIASTWILPAIAHINFGSGKQAPVEVVNAAATYTHIVAFGSPFGMLYSACTAGLRGLGNTKPAMYVAIIANVVNLIGNWLLIFGNLGAPELGVVGCAWATALTRMAMLAAMVIYIRMTPSVRDRLSFAGVFKTARARVSRLISVGLPISVHSVFSQASLTAVTLLTVQLGADQLALHQIAGNFVSVASMLLVAIAIAATTRLALAVGAKSQEQADLAIKAASLVTAVITVPVTIFMLLFPGLIIRAYTSDPAILDGNLLLVRMAALFFFVDAVHTVAAHGLESLLDTKVAMVMEIICRWALAVPLGIVLAFTLGMGASGFWIGNVAGGALLGGLLALRLRVKLRGAVAAG